MRIGFSGACIPGIINGALNISFARPEEPEETAEAGNFEVSLSLIAEII